jgi:hypothetical protein
MPFRLLCIFTLWLLALTSRPAAAQALPKDFTLAVEWTVQQKENGKISQGYHINQLVCGKGTCDLVVVTLNQCFGNEFFPKIERATTRDGSLRVTSRGAETLLLEQPIPGGQIAHRLTIGKDALLGTVRVLGYSGGFTKDSTTLKRVITVEYVPLKGRDVTRPLSCQAMLPGVGTEDE